MEFKEWWWRQAGWEDKIDKNVYAPDIKRIEYE